MMADERVAAVAVADFLDTQFIFYFLSGCFKS